MFPDNDFLLLTEHYSQVLTNSINAALNVFLSDLSEKYSLILKKDKLFILRKASGKRQPLIKFKKQYGELFKKIIMLPVIYVESEENSLFREKLKYEPREINIFNHWLCYQSPEIE